MKKIGWRQALTAALLLSLLSGSGVAPPAKALSPRSAAQERLTALTADAGTWIQPWDKSGTGPYELILGQGTESVCLTPTPEDTSGYPPTMELFARDPAADAEANPLMTLKAELPSKPITVAPGVVQSYWLRSTNWNGDNAFTYMLELYRTPIATEFRIADIQEVNGAKQLSLEIWMDAAVATGLKTVAVDFAFNPQKLQLANAETNESVSAVSSKVGTWADPLKASMTFKASTVDNSKGAFHLELQARNNSDNTATLTCPVSQGRTLMATVAFRLAEGAALDEETLTVEDMWCTELTPENRVLKTAGSPGTGYYSLTGLLPPDLPEPESAGCSLTITDLDGNPLTGTILEGTPIRMTAAPSPGRRFVRWESVDRPAARAAADLTQEVIEVPYSAATTYRPITAQAEYISAEEYDVLPVLDNLILSGIQGRELVRRALAQGDMGFTGLCLQYDLYLKKDETAIGLTPVFRDKWDVTWAVGAGKQESARSKEPFTMTNLTDGSTIHFYINAPGREDVPIEYTVTVHWAEPELLLSAEPFETVGTALSLTAKGGRFYAVELSFDVPTGMDTVEPQPRAGYRYDRIVKDGRMTIIISKVNNGIIDADKVLTLQFPGALNLSNLNATGRVTTDTHMDVSVVPKIEGMVQVTGSVWSYNTSSRVTIKVNRRLTAGGAYAPYASFMLPVREQRTVRAFAQDFSLSLESNYFYELVLTKAGHSDVTLTDLAVGTEDVSLITDYGSRLGIDGIHLPCGDGNKDGSINVFDKAELTNLLRYGGPAAGNWDLDGDGRVNVIDLNILTDRANYGKQKITIQLKEGGA